MKDRTLLFAALALTSLALTACDKPAEEEATEEPAAEEPTLVGDTCATPLALELPAAGATTTVTGTIDDFSSSISDRIEATGYSWEGSDVIYSAQLSAGDLITVGVQDGDAFDGGFYVFSDCANPVGSVVGGHDTNDSTADVEIPADGTYFIVVDAWTAAMTTGEYTLTFQRQTQAERDAAAQAAQAAAAASGASDTCVGATTPLTLPAQINGNIAGGSSVSNDRIEATGWSWTGNDHFYALDLTAGQTINIGLNDGGTYDAGWYLFTDCANIAGSTVAGRDTTATDELTPFTAAAPGRYILAVDAFSGATEGTYTLNVQ